MFSKRESRGGCDPRLELEWLAVSDERGRVRLRNLRRVITGVLVVVGAALLIISLITDAVQGQTLGHSGSQLVLELLRAN